MGPKQSQNNQDFNLSLEHPKFLDAKIIKNSSQQKKMITSVSIKEEEYVNWQKYRKLAQNLSDYLLIATNLSFQSQKLCGTAGFLRLQFPCYPYLLTDQIYNRIGKRKSFSEQQIWQILYSLVDAKYSLYKNGSQLGDIRPQNIFINQKNQIKIANLYSWPHAESSSIRVLEKSVTYLSPEQIKSIQNGQTQNILTLQCQIFSLGLTCFSIATLADVESLYNPVKLSLNENKLTQLKQEFKKSNYSDILKGVILNLCQFCSQGRMDLEQIYTLLLKHASLIINHEKFIVDNANNKLHRQISLLRNIPFQPIGQKVIQINGKSQQIHSEIQVLSKQHLQQIKQAVTNQKDLVNNISNLFKIEKQEQGWENLVE